MRNYLLKFKLSVFILSAFSLQPLAFSLLYAGDIDQAIVHYNQGYDYYKKGEYDKAIEELENSLKFDPNNENAYYGLGNCYYRKQMYEKAIEGYKKSVERNPDFANAHYGLGTAYSALRKTDEADNEFTIYRKLKLGQGQTKGEVAASDKTKKEPPSETAPESKGREPSISEVKPEKKKDKEPSIKSRQKEKEMSFKGLSPEKRIKKILTIPGIKPPGDYIKILAEMWDNSYIGKLFIGIIAFIGVTQIWLIMAAFQGVLLWRMRGKKQK